MTALPLDDGIMVRRSHDTKGKEAMEAVSQDMTSSASARDMLDVDLREEVPNQQTPSSIRGGG